MKRTEKSAAVLTIRDAPQMTSRGQKDIAKWLRRQADFLETNAKDLSSTFRARYLYR